MRRLIALFALAAVVALSAAVVSASGSTVGRSRSTTIRLGHVQTACSAPDNPDRPPAGGDRFTFTNTDLAGGRTIGHDQVSCMAVSGQSAQCTVSLLLRRGVIEAAGALPLSRNPKRVLLAITSGTGTIAGTRSLTVSTELSQTRSTVTINMR